ncbi:MAG: Lrp/AsnC family transcriptional regulator [Dehalococcoidia bacterium]|nr:Lrp/AsnC family transcriptional regulator [Dehalococcoidia bacterium]
MSEQVVREDLDEFDRLLIRELESDARKSYLNLAATLGTSNKTVRRRMQNLVDRGLVSFVTITDPHALGYLTLATLRITTAPGKVDAVATQLASLPNIQTIVATTGSCDIIASLPIRDFEELSDFIARDINSIPEITNTETVLVLKPFKHLSYAGGEAFHGDRRTNGYRLDPLDISLIGELELNPRESISQLAQKLGTSRATVSKKMQALRSQGIMRIVSIPDLDALGYKLWAMLQLKINPAKLDEVVDELARYPNVTHIVMLTGGFQLSVAATFKDRGDMCDFAMQKLGRIPGVVRYETTLNLKSYKRSFKLVAPQSTNGKQN